MTGLLPVNKPKGFTSFDVVAKTRGMTKEKKIGHSGTLDPMATGVLLLFLGGATKAVSVLPCEDKKYIAKLRFGIETDTEDISGRVTRETESRVKREDFESIIPGFLGTQLQMPPMFSAKKVNGVPLYDIARKGGVVERQEKEITVYGISVIGFSEEEQTAEIEVFCGKGTFIRTLIADMGRKLGPGAVMTELTRTEATGFSLSECYSLEEIQKLCDEGNMESALISTERLFRGLPRLVLNDYDKHLYTNGVHLSLSKRGWSGIPGMIAVYDQEDRLLGVSETDTIADELKLLKLL